MAEEKTKTEVVEEVKETKETKTKKVKKTVSSFEELNLVEGFNPEERAKQTAIDGVPYLSVFDRKVWFRLKNPSGRIVPKLIAKDANSATIEASVYLDAKDEKPIAVAYAMRERTNTDIGQRFVENAETAAIGRALTIAGFNITSTVAPDEVEDMKSPCEHGPKTMPVAPVTPVAPTPTPITIEQAVTAPVAPQPETTAPSYVIPPTAKFVAPPQTVTGTIAYETAVNMKSTDARVAGLTFGEIAQSYPQMLAVLATSSIDANERAAANAVLAKMK